MAVLLQNRFVATPAATLQPVVITTASLPSGSTGTAYSQVLSAVGGQPPYNWVLLSAVPDAGNWLSLASNGQLTGTPSVGEIETILPQVIDSLGTKASAFFSFTISAPLLISTASLPGATVGTAYFATLAASGGTPPYTWAMLSDTPNSGSWLTLNPNNGNLSGTPGTAETESLTVQVTDSVGKIVSKPLSLTVSSGVVTWNPAFPRVGFEGIGGTITDLYWNNPTVTVQRLGSIPILSAYAKYHIIVLGSDFESFSHNRQATNTTIKAASTVGTKIGIYGNMMETWLPSDSTNYPTYQTWSAEIINGASNFLLYPSFSSGTPVPTASLDSSTRVFVDYGESAVGTAYAGVTTGIGQNWTPAQWAAYYQYYAKYNATRTGTIPALFAALNTNSVATNMDIIQMDNWFVDPRCVGDWKRNGTSSTTAGNGAYQGTWSDIIANGQRDFCNTLGGLLTAGGGGQWLGANAGDYGRADLGNNQTTAGAMWGVLQYSYFEVGGIGKSFSTETQQTFAAALTNYAQMEAFLAAPKALMLDICIPNGTPLQSGNLPFSATPTAVNGEYQWARYGLAFVSLRNGVCAVQRQTSAYNPNGADLTWYDEYDNGGVAQQWLGAPVDPVQTAPYVWADSSTITSPPVYARRYVNGLVICVGKTGTGAAAQPGGTVTITGAQLGLSTQPLKRISGTQAPAVNTGSIVTSAGVTLQASRDGLFLIETPVLQLLTTSPLPSATAGTAYSTTFTASGGVTPYVWTVLSASPNTGSWMSLNSSTGVLSGTPGTAETESLVVQVKDAVGAIVSAPLSLTVSTSSGFAPNEPAGMTVLLDCTWNKVDSKLGTLPPTNAQLNAHVGPDQYGRNWEGGDGLTHAPLIDTPANLSSIVGDTVTTPPDGAPQVLAIEYPSGEASGTVPFVVFPLDNSFQVQKIYGCCNVWMPTNFHDAGNNIKWFNIEQGGSPLANHIAMLSAGGNGDNGDTRSVWLTIQGGGGLNNPGGVGSLGGGVKNLPNPPGSGTGWWNSMRGKWVTCEWLFTQESPPGSATGQMQTWVSWAGQAPFLVNDFRNLKFNAASGNPNCFNTWKFVPYYGGGGGSAPSIQHLLMSRFRVSGK